jgi:hypothetical protein
VDEQGRASLPAEWLAEFVLAGLRKTDE